MNTEIDPLMQAFHQQRPPGRTSLAEIEARIRAQRRWRRLQRGTEILLSLLAVGVFVFVLAGGPAEPAILLLLPFFALYLPWIWWALLRGARPLQPSTDAAVAEFAAQRLAQLRSSLREAWLARQAARALFAYALAALALTHLLGDVSWRSAALDLLLMALLWALLTWLFLRRQRPRLLREYRALRRLLPSVGATRSA
jgi:hypothetical protein